MAFRFAILVFLGLSLPTAATAGLATLQARELALHGERTLQTASAHPFQLVGIHWQGPGRLELRTRANGVGWSRWLVVREDDGDAPDPGSRESRATGGWRRSAPALGRSCGRPRGPRDRPSHTGEGADGAEPGVDGATAHDRCRGCPEDRAPQRLAGRRGDRPREARLRRHAPHGPRPPHGGDEHLHAARGARGRPRDRDVPRGGQQAGTTSATTRSSTASAPCTRGVRAVSTGTSSERTHGASTPGRSGSP